MTVTGGMMTRRRILQETRKAMDKTTPLRVDLISCRAAQSFLQDVGRVVVYAGDCLSAILQ